MLLQLTQIATKHDYFLLWRCLMQAVVERGVVWLARIVWLTNQRQLFLVPHFSSQSNKI
jgi:hypothetical protein